MTISEIELRKNWEDIQLKVENAALKAGRNKDSVQIIAVTKTQSTAIMESAYSIGIRNFGENYVQEVLPKITHFLEGEFEKINWHFIGNLQSNKIKNIVGKFEYIHSVDRGSIIEEFEKRNVDLPPQKILLEVNLAQEVTKGGTSADDLAKLVERLKDCKNLKLCGLMFMPPLDLPDENLRNYYDSAQKLFQQTKAAMHGRPNADSFTELSMGTSHDFELAIEYGSTMIRVGTSLFGQREKK